MEKKFLDVFPGLIVNDDVRDFIENSKVTKVAVDKMKTAVRIYMLSEQWIPKKHIYALEEAIKRQIFRGVKMNVKIIEKFNLSQQYTAQNFMEAYEESIRLELKNYSAIVYNIFATAKKSFSAPDTFEMTLADTVIAKERGEELIEILEKIFGERCNLDFKVIANYQEAKVSKARKNSEYQIKKTAEEIASRSIGDKASKDKVDNSTGKKKSSGNQRRQTRRSNNPDVLYGRDFDEEAMLLEELTDAVGEVVIRGKVFAMQEIKIRNEKTILIFSITDFTDSIVVKIFIDNSDVEELLADIKKGGSFIKVKGIALNDKFDNELSISSVVGIKKIPNFVSVRTDTSMEKRVELHCHTKMSDMDGVTDAATLVNRAYEWGHKAIAITDHGVVQAFPDANHAVESIDKEYRAQYKNEHPEVDKEELKKIESPFKVIYGAEGYIVDDLKGMVENSKGQSLEEEFVVFDIETTGFSPYKDKIIEIGAVRVTKGEVVDHFSSFVNPQIPIPFKIENLTGINDAMVIEAETIDVVLPKFLEFCEGTILVAHNASFDTSFIKKNCMDLQMDYKFTSLDTVGMARFLMPELNRFKLDTVAKALKVALRSHHRALDDAECTADIFVKFIKMLKEREIATLTQLNEQGKVSANTIKKQNTNHAIILATNEIGRVNLYTLISLSHLEYYNRRPRIPKSVYEKYSEGLIIGAACELGEVYQAILGGADDEEIARIVEFYDYLEIQPLGNNEFLIREERSDITGEDDLIDINKKIVRLGEKFNKPVVATCDVHFIDPQDEIYRRIIMSGKGFTDADKQPPLYFRTTEEMLKEFSYLGAEKAEEVVITNPNLIADRCEKISPIRAGKFPPIIDNSDTSLREICYEKAHEIYGKELPEIVESRLERELNSIISNGYAVMYIIAQKLVWKSVAAGYLVGSRGSVGSSFAATMAGITEVNPLSPHYYCDSCQYSDFESPEVKAYIGKAGCDMPDKTCPKCGTALKKDGFDIPFETFLGFKGNKEPDIDLNFSGEYQAIAHKYTEELFGEGQTFKAGTIGTLADKTAYGYVKNYFEEHGIYKRKCEVDRIVKGCTGVRRTTGQHPGGIIVLPHGENINAFTPIQHPANDMHTDIVTTHFDYHSIDENLLKLDILGHDDPTMVHMLEGLTGIDPQTIPLDDKKAMSLFQDTTALGIEPKDIEGCKLGCLGIPEFGTDFVIQMLVDAKPETVSDIVCISGLSHGTNVWIGNAQELIKSGQATLSTAICTRDDIMTYLIKMGVESNMAFTIMESVRKGGGLKPLWEETMLENDVPEWYIQSCKLIKYMFPKAHAAAYVTMALRIAYYKIYYPLEYYAAYFSIRAKAFSYELMCLGQERLLHFMSDYKKRNDALSKKEQDSLKDMRLVQEMYARGFDFLPVDIYVAKAHHCQIIDGKIMPPLDSIEGLGDKAADMVVEAVKDGKFLSKDDFRQRTKVSKTVIELMSDLKLFGELPEANQISLFDM